MSNEYVVVMGDTIVGDSSKVGPAENVAREVASKNLGGEVAVYRRETIFKARVEVYDDRPTAMERKA